MLCTQRLTVCPPAIVFMYNLWCIKAWQMNIYQLFHKRGRLAFPFVATKTMLQQMKFVSK